MVQRGGRVKRVMKGGVLCAVVTGCKPVEPPPADLDQLSSTLWRSLAEPEANLDALARAFVDVIPEGFAETGLVDGDLSRLAPEDLVGLPFAVSRDDDTPADAPDPALARGFFLIDRVFCTGPQLDAVLAFPDQNALYNNYHAYSRTYFGDRQAFLATDAPGDLAWEGSIEVRNVVVGRYEYDFDTTIWRRGPDGLHARIGRTHMPYPAIYDNENRSLDQDYQLELYVQDPEDPGAQLHFFTTWRQMDLGTLGTMESDDVVRITLNQMAIYDEKTSDLCASGAAEGG